MRPAVTWYLSSWTVFPPTVTGAVVQQSSHASAPMPPSPPAPQVSPP